MPEETNLFEKALTNASKRLVCQGCESKYDYHYEYSKSYLVRYFKIDHKKNYCANCSLLLHEHLTSKHAR